MSDDELDDQITMPFVLTEKHGGPYDTEAFAAGWFLGVLEARLAMASTANLVIPPVPLKTIWRRQADLMAMSHGYMLTVQISKNDPDYAFFTFTPPGLVVDDDS